MYSKTRVNERSTSFTEPSQRRQNEEELVFFPVPFVRGHEFALVANSEVVYFFSSP